MNPTIEQVDPRILGMRLQEARKSAGMTQSEAADHLRMSRTTIVAIEKGQLTRGHPVCQTLSAFCV
jgi:DNA-binding XRE family transcriptional regulator